MSKIVIACLVIGISISSTFSCNGMTLSEAKIVVPSLSPLCENFRYESTFFKQQAESTVEELKRISGDDAFLLSSRLQQNMHTVKLLEYLITQCKDGLTQKIKQDQKTKGAVLEICGYLTGVMPYAGKMQDVISAILSKEFGISSINELEKMAK